MRLTAHLNIKCICQESVIAKPKVVKFCTQVGDIDSSNRLSPTKEAWLWSRDCFKMLPFVVMQRVCQRHSWATCCAHYSCH